MRHDPSIRSNQRSRIPDFLVMATQTLNIEPGSDGDGRKWPKHHYDRNDEYFLERVAEQWIKDLPGGLQPGITYRLNRLPTGYAGFQKARPDSKHVDRYIYGHPNGQFRSLTEFYPHFKNLMDMGSSDGCGCVKCAGTVKKTKDVAAQTSKYFAESNGKTDQGSREPLISPMRTAGITKKGRYSPEDYQLPQRKDVDFEGTPDAYEKLIRRLRDTQPEGIDEMVEEKMSPDWRAVNAKLTDTLKKTRRLPRYAPRIGELVMFVRKLNEGECLAWNKSSNTFKRVDTDSNTWREAPKWEAGVITQMPEEEISEQDLTTDLHKQQSIIYSGFKIEPLSEPGNDAKPYSRQHKHVPLHVIRQFAMWQDCLRGTPENMWHPTVKHALTVSSSLCPIGRYRFKGTWPNASIFCRALYLGSELILHGDTVRLLPKNGEQGSKTVTDVMVISAIRLQFVNLDFDEDDLAPTAPALPYQTSVHVSGKVFTTDPSRSFNGVSKYPIDPKNGNFPPGLGGHGPWYHYSDPSNPASRIEVPFSRIVGRLSEHSAINTLFTGPSVVKPEVQPPIFKPVNAPKPAADSFPTAANLLSTGMLAIQAARRYSQEHDARLTSTEQPWFWADTRIEQLDLHEVNGRYVGAKGPMRTKDQLSRWQKALKGLDGNKGGLEEYHAARKQRVEEERAAVQSKGGMMGSAAVDAEMESITNGESGDGEEEDGEEIEDGEEDEEGEDAMEVDESPDVPEPARRQTENAAPAAPRRLTIDLMDSEDEEEMAHNQLVGELLKKVRPGASRG